MNQKYNPNKRSVTGRYSTSSECYRCELCMNLLPEVFTPDESGQSFIQRQPRSYAEHKQMLEVIENCPIRGIIDHSKASSDFGCD